METLPVPALDPQLDLMTANVLWRQFVGLGTMAAKAAADDRVDALETLLLSQQAMTFTTTLVLMLRDPVQRARVLRVFEQAHLALPEGLS